MRKEMSVYVVVIDGLPQNQVFTSLSGACEFAGITVRQAQYNEYPDGVRLSDNGRFIIIARGYVVKQSKGRKDFAPKHSE